MMRFTRFQSLVLLGFLFPICLFSQSASDGFMKPKGQLDIALSLNSETAKSYFLADSTQQISFPSSTIGTFVSYGLGEKLNLITTLPLVNGELQDLSLLLKISLFDGLVGDQLLKANFSLGGSLPASSYRTDIQKAIGQQLTQAIGIGNVQWHFHDNLFVNTSLRLNLAENNSTFGSSLKLGFIKDKWYADAWFDRQVALNDTDYKFPYQADSLSSTVIVSDMNEVGISYGRLGGTVYHQSFNTIGFFAGWGLTLDGRNSWDITRFTVGLNYTPLKN